VEESSGGGRCARKVIVDGRVQGVGFRQACAQAARRNRVAGWVRNRRDGRVEALFEGPTDAVVRMIEWCRAGPPLASVTEVAVSEVAPEGRSDFRVGATG
jgi:acylphosphatase